MGGPGTNDPTRMTFTWTPMFRLLTSAFALPLDQISGPDWLMGQDVRFDIAAILPAGVTKDQANEMLLNLLKDRFHLTYHLEKKDFDLYALVVAKGRAKAEGCRAGRWSAARTSATRSRCQGRATGSRRVSAIAGRTSRCPGSDA
jgi:uncharacterized protein (TIGR03435 family)